MDDNVVEIGKPVEKKIELKRLAPTKVTTETLNDVMASLEAFRQTGLVLFLDQAMKSMSELYKIAHE